MANPKGNPQNLLPGGKIGNRGGRGSIPSKIRQKAREGFAEGLDYAILVATGRSHAEGTPCPTAAEVVRAVDLLGKYGLGALTSINLESSEIATMSVQALSELTKDMSELSDERSAWLIQAFADRLCTEAFNLGSGEVEESDEAM